MQALARSRELAGDSPTGPPHRGRAQGHVSPGHQNPSFRTDLVGLVGRVERASSEHEHQYRINTAHHRRSFGHSDFLTSRKVMRGIEALYS